MFKFQTPSAVKRVKELLGNQQNYVSLFYLFIFFFLITYQNKLCNLAKNLPTEKSFLREIPLIIYQMK